MQPWEHSRAARLAGPLGLSLLALGGAIALSCIGLPSTLPKYLGPVSFITAILSAGPIALAYLVSGFGLGRPLAAWLARDSRHRYWIQLGLGIGLLLWLSHALGMAGLLSGAGSMPRIVGWSVVGLGILLVADQITRGPLRPERWPVIPPAVMLLGPALAVLLIAAANPTGVLWHATEHGAFDTLSYHLQLPKEWATGERLWPTPHNVYSYLPSFVEAAYLHLGTLMPGGGDPLVRMIAGSAGEGHWFLACQYLHVGLAIISALLIARAAWALASRCGVTGAPAAWLAVIAGALTLSTPWMVVVSTLPYNEAGLIAMAAAGVLIALDDGCAPWARGIGAGWTVGIACGCKPTALIMVGPMVGLLLLGAAAPKAWWRIIAGGSLAGILAVAPWMIRNFLAARNPAFPFASSIFGTTGGWTEEQFARFARNHHAPPGLGILARAERLVSEQFGLLHEQWGSGGCFAVLVLVATGAAVVWPPSRRFGALLFISLLAQTACWMTLTHLQSRFLLPLLVPASLLLVLGASALLAAVGRSPASRRTMTIGTIAVLSIGPVAQAMASVLLFLEQNGLRPNQMLVVGPGAITGMGAEAEFAHAPPETQQSYLDSVGPAAFINLSIRPWEAENRGVYLLGDSTPLNFMGRAGAPSEPSRALGSPIIYHTTWDAAPIISTADVPDWSSRLHESGIRYVLVNYDELHRLIDTDHNYDPAITFEKIMRWIDDRRSKLRSVRTWRDPNSPPHSGSELFLIDIPFSGPNLESRGGGRR
jgi:hypothetical protein